MLELSQDVDFHKDRLDITLALFDTALLNCFESEFRLFWITLSITTVHFCKITPSKKWSHVEFVFEVKEDADVLQLFKPFVDNLLILVVKLETLSFSHQYEAKKLGLGVFEMRLL